MINITPELTRHEDLHARLHRRIDHHLLARDIRSGRDHCVHAFECINEERMTVFAPNNIGAGGKGG